MALVKRTWQVVSIGFFDVNTGGVLHGTAAALPDMKASGSAQIINVASIGANSVAPIGAVYCATKYAVWAISDGLRQENTDLRVTVISPGVVESELAHSISDAGTAKAMVDHRRIAIPPDVMPVPSRSQSSNRATWTSA